MSITISEIANTSTHLSGNPIRVKATTSGIPTNASEYKIMLKLISVDNVLAGSPFIDAITPDSNGVAEFDISGYMDQPVEKDFFWPIPGQWDGKWHGYVDQVYDVQIVAGERYIDINNLLLAQLNDAGTNWFDYFSTGGRWLTYMPITQYVGPYQPVKLWWKPPQTGLSFIFNVKGYYSDGSTKSYTGTPVMWYDVMFEYELHPSGLDIPPISGTAKLLYYEAWMTGTPNVEKRTFIIDWIYHEETWYLFADNKIGGIDCIMLTGAVRYKPTAEKSIAVKPFEKGMGVKQRTKLVVGNNRTRHWTINSGYKTKDELSAMAFLLDSPNAWLAVPPSGGSTDIAAYTIIPVIVSNTELQLTYTMNDLESVDIEFTEAF